MHHTLEELGHPQGRTPIQTDNSTAHGVIHRKRQPKQNKAMNMRFFDKKWRSTKFLPIPLEASQ